MTTSSSTKGDIPYFKFGGCSLYKGDCVEWLSAQPAQTIHGVVTDPPYGLVEYSAAELRKRKKGKGVWRLPPTYDGFARAPLPRFTTLTNTELEELASYFKLWGEAALRVLVPGAHMFVASNPLVSFMVSDSLNAAGFQRRGEIIRLVRTMRGGDRPKGAHKEFTDTSVIPRSHFEPWLLFRKPLDGRIQDCLRTWGTGALRRPADGKPFPDVFASGVTPIAERAVAKHPTIKPQRFLRQIVRAVLPLGTGVVLDPFAGSGSTLAAAEAVGYESVGVELVGEYCLMAKRAVPKLAAFYQDGAEGATPPPV